MFQVTPENAETQSWGTKTVWQRIAGRRAHNCKTPTTITVQSITRNDHFALERFEMTAGLLSIANDLFGLHVTTKIF